MKNSDYILMETALQNASDSIEEAYELCDTSGSGNKYENDFEITDWNKRFNKVMEELTNLRSEMIFTFHIEEEEEAEE